MCKKRQQLYSHTQLSDNMTCGADAIQKAVDKKTPGQPRTIRSQVGLTQDPVPEGKKIAEPEHHHDVEPASHGSSDPGNNAGEELSKEGVKGHKEELKHMQNQASKYDSASNPLNKNAPTQSASDMKGVQQQ
ncbi:hypothetical protein WJX77_009217 [Trebouxia sp. C0004]